MSYCRRCGVKGLGEYGCAACKNKTSFLNYCKTCGRCINSIMFSQCGWCLGIKK